MYAAALSIDETHDAGGGEQPEHIPVDYVRGIENPTEGSKNILRWLVREGYGDEDIAKVMGENIMRVLGEVWQ